MQRRWLRVAALVITTAVMGGLATWTVWALGPDQISQAFARAHPASLLLLLGVFAVNHATRTLRFAALLGPEAPLPAVVWTSLVGFMAMTVVPLRLGEAVRPALLVGYGVPLAQSVAASVVERILDLAVLLALLAWVAFAAPLAVELVVEGVDLVATGQRLAGVTAGAALLGLLGLAAAGPDRLQALPMAGGALASLAAAIRELGAAPMRTAWAMMWTLASWGTAVGYVWATLRAFEGLPTTLTASTLTWTAIITGVTAAPTPGFFGSFEASAVVALVGQGASAATAAAMALTLHVAYLAFTVTVGAVALWWLGVSIRTLWDPPSAERSAPTPAGAADPMRP